MANVFPAFQHSNRKKRFSCVGMEFHVFWLCLLPLVLSQSLTTNDSKKPEATCFPVVPS